MPRIKRLLGCRYGNPCHRIARHHTTWVVEGRLALDQFDLIHEALGDSVQILVANRRGHIINPSGPDHSEDGSDGADTVAWP